MLPGLEGESCMLSQWPQADEALMFPDEAARMEGIMDIIRSVRNLRAELKVQPGTRARLLLRPQAGWAEALRGAEGHFRRLAGVSELELLADGQAAQGKTVSAVTAAAELFIPLGELVDLAKEAQRLRKELEQMEKEIQRGEAKLQNEGFLSKAPAALVEQEKKKLEDNRAMLEALGKRLAEMDA